MKDFKKIKDIVTEVEDDVSKFYDKKNQAAGTRLRKAMQEVKTLAQKVRVHVQETKNKSK